MAPQQQRSSARSQPPEQPAGQEGRLARMEANVDHLVKTQEGQAATLQQILNELRTSTDKAGADLTNQRLFCMQRTPLLDQAIKDVADHRRRIAELEDLPAKVDQAIALAPRVVELEKLPAKVDQAEKLEPRVVELEKLAPAMRIVIWIAGALGLSIIGFLWSILIGKVQIAFIP